MAFPLSLILLAGSWPYWFTLRLWPVSRDAVLWISRASLFGPEWFDWVFATRHFKVGYRPIAALSYSLDYLLGGLSPLPYRLTDLALHAACGLFVYLLYRRLAPELPRWGGWVAAGIFVAHPIAEQVVPHLARRSYSLAVFFGLASLLALVPRDTELATASSTSRLILRSLPGALLLACALLANETAFVTVAMLPLLLYRKSSNGVDGWRGLFVTCLLPGALAIAVLLVRSTVIAGVVGGYGSGVDPLARLLPITVATWRSLGAVAPVPGAEAGLWSRLWFVGFALVSIYYVGRAVAGAVRYRGDRAAGLPTLMLLWIVGFLLFYAPMGVWFPRQVYPVLVPFSLLIGLVLANTVRRNAGTARGLTLQLAPQLFLVALVLFPSPVLRGADPLRVAAWRETDRVQRELHAAIDLLAEPARIQFAVPYFTRPVVHSWRAREGRRGTPRPGRQVEIWMRTLFRDRAFLVDYFLVYERNPLDPEPPPLLVTGQGLPALVLAVDQPHYVQSARPVASRGPDTITLGLGPAPTPGVGARQFYYHNGSTGSMQPIF